MPNSAPERRARSGRWGPAASGAVPALINNLADGSDEVRQDSVDALGQIGAAARPALSSLRWAMRMRNAARERRAPWRNSAAAAKDTAPTLIPILEKEKDPAARIAQITALPKTGPDRARAVPLLVAAATDPDDAIRHAGINALAGARALHADAVRALAGLLKNSDPALRQRAARALGRLGPDAASALPALVDAARASNGDDAFTDTLTEIGPAALPGAALRAQGREARRERMDLSHAARFWRRRRAGAERSFEESEGRSSSGRDPGAGSDGPGCRARHAHTFHHGVR
jgi:HEAT repeat protein